MDPRPHPFAAKLTFDEAEEVRRLRARGTPLAELAEKFRMAKSSISSVVHLHSHIPAGTLRIALPIGELDLLRELASDEAVPIEQLASDLLVRALRAGEW
jgi:hypothetical protein